jgi:diguanylate cyclase (GGDEF)-like protein
MHLDFSTLFWAMGAVTSVTGLLLLFSWLQERRSTSLAYWGAAYSIMALGGLVFAGRHIVPPVVAYGFGGGLVLFGFGLIWSGARTFEGRKPNLALAAAGGAIWLALIFSGAVGFEMFPRITIATGIIIFYLALTMREYWYARDRELLSRWPVLVLLFLQVVLFSLRAFFAEHLPFPGGAGDMPPQWVPVGFLAMLINTLALPFLVMSMTKERLEREQRRLALADPLTGIANRRAFFERGERILRRAAFSKEPVALLLLDLDLFKSINDTFGHQAGDRVLQDFAAVVGAALRPNDFLGRLGGEEFACLLPNADAAQAAQAAERIRAKFGTYRLPDSPAEFRFSVSIGVAEAADFDFALPAMLASADRALYRAKANGRNRVEQAWTGAAMTEFRTAAS